MNGAEGTLWTLTAAHITCGFCRCKASLRMKEPRPSLRRLQRVPAMQCSVHQKYIKSRLLPIPQFFRHRASVEQSPSRLTQVQKDMKRQLCLHCQRLHLPRDKESRNTGSRGKERTNELWHFPRGSFHLPARHRRVVNPVSKRRLKLVELWSGWAEAGQWLCRNRFSLPQMAQPVKIVQDLIGGRPAMGLTRTNIPSLSPLLSTRSQVEKH
jgi:hypothetical protein